MAVLKFTPKGAGSGRKSTQIGQNRPENCTQVQFLPKYVTIQHGDWYVRISFPRGRKANGKVDYVQVKRKCEVQTPEAAEQLAKEIKALYAQAKSAPDGESLEAFLVHFLAAKKTILSRKVYESNEGYLDRMLPAHIKAKPIDKIVPLDIQRLYNSFKKTPSTIRKFHRILSSVFEQAVSWDVIPKNPCKGLILPPDSKPKIVSLDQAQARALLAECHDKPEYFIFEFLLETGLRPSEALALTWDDIGDSVSVNKALVRGFIGGGYEIGDTKTESSVRTVDISARLSDRLVEHRARQIDRMGVLINKKKGKRDKQELHNLKTLKLVFPAERGGYQTVGNLNKRVFAAVATKIGVKGSLYCLRHSMATLSLAAGADLKTISQKLGHTDPSVTLKVYLHVLKSMKSDATDKLASILYDSPAT